ncbi:MAG TPA: hypothetical protein VMK42_11555 [Anaeromyxobacteraceae bacterium]|nr:hypothetical protein [Anaeromyxobacteraceae bacterium]
MKYLGMALAVGIVIGPLGVMGVGYALVGLVLAVGLSALGGGMASALGFAPTREEAERARRWD